ncbi:MFS transporter [Streptomyces uncialis]|uniref:MFS transporter n=1 Tax=Streptomyces uncialis TaxID=1048205 RepID=UPI00225B2130|nr:MFS transporter [Streptomyces uncialis]MCX4657715.1 MFS transporter [Streptomyces uncialis]
MTASRPRVGSRPRLSGPARLTVALLFAAWFIDYADRLIINLVLPSIGEEFDLSRSQQGVVLSVFFLAYALCQIPGGMLADRFGGRRMVLWALAAWTVFTVLTGFAWSFAALLVLRVLFGLAQGVFPPAAAKVLAERTGKEERMRANGLVLSSNSLAAVFTPLAVAPLVAAFGWRSAYISVAAIGVFVYTAIRMRLPQPLPQAPGGEEGDSAVAEGSAAAPRSDVRALLRWGTLWRFAAMMFGYSIIIWGLNSWVPTYLNDERGVPIEAAGPLLAVPALAATIGTIIGGQLSDRLAGQHWKVIVPGMSVAAAALLLMAYASGLAAFVVFGTVAIFATSLSYMPIFAVPMRSLPARQMGVATGVIIFGGQLAGVVAPSVMGVLADAFSFQVAFAFLVLGAVVAAVMACLTPQTTEALLADARGRVPDAVKESSTSMEKELP